STHGGFVLQGRTSRSEHEYSARRFVRRLLGLDQRPRKSVTVGKRMASARHRAALLSGEVRPREVPEHRAVGRRRAPPPSSCPEIGNSGLSLLFFESAGFCRSSRGRSGASKVAPIGRTPA